MGSIMIERKEKQKKGIISEEDISTLLERYSVSTILTLLREVAQVSDVRIDWDKLVKNTSTGISNAREYQMLWRHLAYRHTLLENMDCLTGSPDDDSDLDFEIEPFPSVNSESLNEAAAFVKVLIANAIPSESDIPSSSAVEAPLTIGISNSQSSRANLENPESGCLMQEMYVTIPISIQRQPISTPAASTEVFDVNGAAGGNAASRKRRKPWSKAEDMELIAAVQKCGEGNWANILKGDFKGDRTASQLSQRWSIIRKRRGNLNVGANATGTQMSKAQIDATHRALSFALDLPVNNSKTESSNINSSIISSASGSEARVQMQNQSPQIPLPSRPVLVEPSPSAVKPGINTSKSPLMMKSTHNSDSIVRATAVAAGARIVSPSDAASLLKAAQAKNAIHIKSSCASSIKPPVLGNALMHSDPRPSIHYISTGKLASPGLNYVGGKPSMICNNSVKAISPKVRHNRSTSAILMNPQSDQRSPATGSPLKQEIKSSEECKIPEPITTPKEEAREDEAVRVGNFASQRSDGEFRSLSTCIENHNGSNMEINESDIKAGCSEQVETKKSANDVEIRGSPDTQVSKNESVADNLGGHSTKNEQMNLKAYSRR